MDRTATTHIGDTSEVVAADARSPRTWRNETRAFASLTDSPVPFEMPGRTDAFVESSREWSASARAQQQRASGRRVTARQVAREGWGARRTARRRDSPSRSRSRARLDVDGALREGEAARERELARRELEEEERVERLGEEAPDPEAVLPVLRILAQRPAVPRGRLHEARGVLVVVQGARRRAA